VSNFTFKHSGTLGDIIYSLPIMRHFGGGKFYLHMNQIDWIGKHYYGAEPNPFHQGRMTIKDYEFLKDFFLVQDYIESCEPLDTKLHAITHNLDRFRPPFVGHPGNYVDLYADVFGIKDPDVKTQLRTTPWLSVPNPKRLDGVTTVISRTTRWVPNTRNPVYDKFQADGWNNSSVFVGLPDEHKEFERITGWSVAYHPVKNLLEMAELIAGADRFIGNQSVALSVAIGLGKEFWCEARRDLPIERNECYFPQQPKGNYF